MISIAKEILLFPFFAIGWFLGKCYRAYGLMRDAILCGFLETVNENSTENR
jgi:hypothetical protein